jgi:hypothetical protein
MHQMHGRHAQMVVELTCISAHIRLRCCVWLLTPPGSHRRHLFPLEGLVFMTPSKNSNRTDEVRFFFGKFCFIKWCEFSEMRFSRYGNDVYWLIFALNL